MKIKLVHIILIISFTVFSCGNTTNQKRIYSGLDQLLLESSRDSFLVNKGLNLIDDLMQDEDEYVHKILFQGEISSLIQNLNFISILPSLKEKRGFPIKIEFKHLNLNDKNLTEALILDYLNTISNDILIDYILKRATTLFQNESEISLKELNINEEELNTHISDDINRNRVIKTFSNMDTTISGVFINGNRYNVSNRAYQKDLSEYFE